MKEKNEYLKDRVDELLTINQEYQSSINEQIKENKTLQDELDKFRDLYFHEIDKWTNKYTNDYNDPCDRFHTNKY